MKRCFVKVIVLFLAGILILGACSKTTTTTGGTTTSGTNEEIIIALQGEPTSLDAQYPDDGNMRPVTNSIYQRLFEVNGQTLAPEPTLALEAELLNPTTWRVKLRQGVKFHDGGDFTAEDAAFSINRIINPDYGSQIMNNFDAIKEAVVVDRYTVDIITLMPDPIMIKRLCFLPIVSKAFTEGKTNDQLTMIANGTGPYKFVEWRRGVSITIERFDGYWGPQPAIKRAVFRALEEPATRLSALKTGEVHIAVNLYPEFVAEIPKVFAEIGNETYWVRFNQFNGPMVDRRMRLAANYAIDLEAIAEHLFMGYAMPAEGQMAKPGYFGYNPNVKMYEYNPERAKQLLAEAGYNGEVIQLISERGRWLKDGEITEAIASMLIEAGFNVETRIVSWNEWLDTLFDRSKTPALQYSSTGNEFMDMDRTYSALVHNRGTQSGVNNATLNQMIDGARSEMDETKRKAMYDDLAQRLYDDPFGIYLLYMSDLHGGVTNLNWIPRRDSDIRIAEMSFN